MTAATAQRHPLNMTADGSLAMPGREVFVVRRSEGPSVEDIDGRTSIDGLSGP
jgi:adenosylmethionine-8-amino-7-oxononanoate aminotransferase